MILRSAGISSRKSASKKRSRYVSVINDPGRLFQSRARKNGSSGSLLARVCAFRGKTSFTSVNRQRRHVDRDHPIIRTRLMRVQRRIDHSLLHIIRYEKLDKKCMFHFTFIINLFVHICFPWLCNIFLIIYNNINWLVWDMYIAISRIVKISKIKGLYDTLL